MSETIAILDACVLYPAPLRDFLMHLALANAFRARWSEVIHDEWMRNVLAERPDLSLTQLTRTKELMNAAILEAAVEGFEPLVDTLDLPDANDRHVLAAAIRADASLIVTFNLKDFPIAKLAPFGVAAIHPDKFVVAMIADSAESVLTAFKRQHNSLKNPPRTIPELLETLQANGLPETVVKLRELLDL